MMKVSIFLRKGSKGLIETEPVSERIRFIFKNQLIKLFAVARTGEADFSSSPCW